MTIIVDTIQPWVLIYAYLPKKTITGKWVWLTPIYRCRRSYFDSSQFNPYDSYSERYEYGSIFDVLASKEQEDEKE